MQLSGQTAITRTAALELARELSDAVNDHDVARLIACYDVNAVTVSPVAGEIKGIEQIASWWHEIFQRFPDWHVQTHDVLFEGDRLAFFGTATATDNSGWFGQPPTGERFTYRALILLNLRDGKIIRDERIYDSSALMQRLEKLRLDQELKLAAQVQRMLMPRTGCSTAFCQVAADSLACRAIGGDFFEVTALPRGGLGLALGDVAGKGPSAALLAAMTQGMLNVELEADLLPSAVLKRLNRRLLSRGLQPRFTTLVYATIAPTGEFACSNAGHNAPIIVTKNGIRRICSGGPILGMFGDATFEHEVATLQQGDILLFFSDGVVEARNSNGREFGDDRLVATVKECHGNAPSEILNSILSDVRSHCAEASQEDDITVLVARYGHEKAAHSAPAP